MFKIEVQKILRLFPGMLWYHYPFIIKSPTSPDQLGNSFHTMQRIIPICQVTVPTLNNLILSVHVYQQHKLKISYAYNLVPK